MMAMTVGLNKTIKKMKTSSGQARFAWEVTKYGKSIDAGVEDSEKEADKQAWIVIRTLMESKTKTAEQRKVHKLKIRQLLEKRPYLVGGICELVIAVGADKVRCMEEAESQEKAWWANDPPKYRKPLMTHHLALKPHIAAGKLIDDFVGAGLMTVDEGGKPVQTHGLRAWAKKVFGEGRGF